MAPIADTHQANDVPADVPARYLPRQPHNDAPQNAQAPPPAEGHREGPGRAQNPQHHVDVAFQGIVDYHPRPIENPAFVFQDVGHQVQGVPGPVQVQPGAPVPVNHDLFGYFPQPGPHPQAVFPHHLIPTPNQPRLGAENMRQLAYRYLDHPDGRVRIVCTEEAIAGGFRTVIIVETPNVL